MLGVYLLGLLAPNYVRLGVIASVIICAFTFEYFIRSSFKIGRGIDLLVLTYVLYNLISFSWYLFSSLPVSVYIQEFSNSILPVFFYFFAKTKHNENNSFFSKTLVAIVLFFAIGFILFIWQPYFYRYFLSLHDGVGTNPLATSEYFRSIIGLTATGSLATIGILISFSTIFETKGKKGKIAFIICLTAVILTFRRSALFVSFASIIALHYIAYFKFKLLKKRFLLIEILIVLGIIIISLYNNPEFMPSLIERISMIFEAFRERSDSWREGLKDANLIIGSGLGVYSHKAIPFNEIYVPDGNYARMIAEIGIIGTTIFLSIILLSLIEGFKNLRKKYLETGIIIAICLIALGSNIFSFQLIVPVFWYAIGQIHQQK